MNGPAFAEFKYAHPDRGSMSRAAWIFFGLGAAVAVALTIRFFPIGAFAFVIPLICLGTRKKTIRLGPRYLLCGNSIVYYNNVERLTLSKADGALRVQSASGKVFLLEREKFPTGARKADKIKRNKEMKFQKVSGKIIEKVRKAAPAAELIGI